MKKKKSEFYRDFLKNLSDWHWNNLKIYFYFLLVDILNNKSKLALVKGEPKAPFSVATTPRCRGGHYSFPWIAPLYPNLIILSAKQGGVKYHFLSLWYDSTWDWTRSPGQLTNTLFIRPKKLLYIFVCSWSFANLLYQVFLSFSLDSNEVQIDSLRSILAGCWWLFLSFFHYLIVELIWCDKVRLKIPAAFLKCIFTIQKKGIINMLMCVNKIE